jgi:hypothetical protein
MTWICSLPMTATIPPAQLQILQSDEFLAVLDPDFRDYFQDKLREETNGNYAIMDFRYSASTIIEALRQFAREYPDSAANAEQLIDQIEASL